MLSLKWHLLGSEDELKTQACWLTCIVWDAITNEVYRVVVCLLIQVCLIFHFCSTEVLSHHFMYVVYSFSLFRGIQRHLFIYLFICFVWNCSESNAGKIVLVWPRKCSGLQWFLSQNDLQNVLKSIYWPWESSFFTCMWIKGDILTLWYCWHCSGKSKAVCIILSFFLGCSGCSSCSVFQLLSKTGKNKNSLQLRRE